MDAAGHQVERHFPSETSYHWDPREPDTIQFWIKDNRFSDVDHRRPGMLTIYSVDPRSADYSPANFNRVARALRQESRPAPAQDAPEYDRDLAVRPAVIASLDALARSGRGRFSLAPRSGADELQQNG